MGSNGYSVSDTSHAVKHMVNCELLGRYAGRVYSDAVVIPSVTCCDIEICRELGMFDESTRFLAFERGGLKDELGFPMGPHEFYRRLKDRMDGIFGVKRWLNTFCETRYMDVKDSCFGLERDYAGRFTFGFYDTCSFPYDVGVWFRHQAAAFATGSPVLFTFDADYSKRDSRCKMTGIRQHRGVNVRWYGSRCKDDGLAGEVEVKSRRVAWLISECGVVIDDIACYKESDGGRKKVMMVIAGRKTGKQAVRN